MSKHQNIVDNVKVRMKTILTTGGYETNVGENVYINKSNKLIAASNEDAINIADISISTITARSGGVVSYFDHSLALEISVFCKGSNSDVKIRNAVWDISKAIGTDLTWSGLAINTYPPEGSDYVQFVYEQEENIIVGAKVYIIIEFRTTQWQSQ